MPLGPMHTKAQKRAGMQTVMHEWKHGDLHSGSKTGPLVKNRKQAIAIALHQTGQSKYARGGPLGGFHLKMMRPHIARPIRGPHFKHLDSGGYINSDVPGRTDKHYVTVPSGSYVLPADHVSALGQNNSNAGADVVRKMFAAGTKYGPRLTIPHFAGGGGVGEPTPIVVAGGEMIIPPHIVRRIGGGDIDKGHATLDRWIMETRKRHISKLESLKPPKGSK